jgi:hypothetical protein
MAEVADVTAAVLRALRSELRGMTRGKLVSFVGDDLGVVIDGKKHLERLLPKMRENGLIIADKSTYFITEKGKDAIPEAASSAIGRRPLRRVPDGSPALQARARRERKSELQKLRRGDDPSP